MLPEIPPASAPARDPLHEMDEMEHLRLISTVTLRLGLIMLKNGASSSRADEAMRRAGTALGADRVEPYVTPTGIIATVHSKAGDHTQIARIRELGVNMQRVHEAELLLRRLKNGADPVAVNAELERIETLPPLYPAWALMIASGLGCGAFAVLRGGAGPEFAAAFFAASAAQALRGRLRTARLSILPISVVCAMVASGLAILLVRLLSATQPELGVIASVLLLVPGAALVTSLLDLLNGNLVSGIMRGVYALLILVAVSTGVLVMLTLLDFRIV